MNNTSEYRNNGGVGVAGILGFVFIALKLSGVIGWSWIWVLAPFWIPVVFVLVVIMFMSVVLLAFSLINMAVTVINRIERSEYK